MTWTERSFRKEVARVRALAAAEGRELWIAAEDEKQRRRGRLLLRVKPSGAAHWYFRYAPASGERDTLPLGRYGEAGFSLDGARMRAARFSALLRSDATRDIRAHRRDILDRLRAQREAARRKREATLSAATAADFTRSRSFAMRTSPTCADVARKRPRMKPKESFGATSPRRPARCRRATLAHAMSVRSCCDSPKRGRDARPASFAVTYALRIKRRSLVIRWRSRNSSLTQTQ